MSESTPSYSPEDKLIELQQFILMHFPGAAKRRLAFGLDRTVQHNADPLYLLKAFTNAVLSGQMPEPNVLMDVAMVFDRYLKQTKKQGMSLDDAFELSGTQSAGNPAQKANSDRERNKVFFEIFMHRIQLSNPSIPAAIKEVLLQRGMPSDEDAIESWRTRYSKCSWKECEDEARKNGFSAG